jgi:hypothetical protein
LIWILIVKIEALARKKGVLHLAFSLSNENTNQYQNGNDLSVKASLDAYYYYRLLLLLLLRLAFKLDEYKK